MASPSAHLLFFAFFIPIYTSLAQNNNGIIPLGTIISANETGNPWLSPSGDFAFGFQQIQGQDQFLLSVWYNHIPDQTLAWYLSSTDPVPKGSTLKLDAQYGLILNDPQGKFIWKAVSTISKFDHGFMNDTGNFILISSDNNRLWQSFDSPIDTILPLQELVPGNILVSRKTESSFLTRRFYLVFQENGDFTLSTRSTPDNTIDDDVYYNSQTSDPVNASNSGERLVFDQEGFLYILRRNNQTTDMSPRVIPSVSENYYKATLNFDGVFTLSYHPRNFSGSMNWTDVWVVPENICLSINGEKGSGACGYNSICKLVCRRPVCECPERYELVDPNDEYGSCKPNFTLSCNADEGSSSYDFVELVDIDWPQNDYEMSMASSEDKCKGSCLEDCLCVASILRNNTCWKKKSPLSNGRVDENLSSKVYLKYDKSTSVVGGLKPKKRGALVTVLSVLLGSSVFMNIFLFGVITCFGYYSICGCKKVSFHSRERVLETNTRCFTYKELEEATNGFKDEAGRGSFGIVYRGMLHAGSEVAIAVKKLDRVAIDAEKEFRAEVNTIGQTHHKNLVQLLGFCDEKQHRLLVYEYMSNGTLASLPFGDLKPRWNLRTQIAIGLSRAITYLHEECSTHIIHCDIKPQNILLDENYNARISDFGLAKLLVLDQSRTVTNIRGTKGYVAPEWFRNTQVTAKVDVYSFGVMLLEIICCRRNLENVGIDEEDNVIILVDWVWDCFLERRLDSLVEGDLEALADWNTMERFVKVGIWCIQEDANLRPTMRKVSLMLEGIVEVSSPPCPDPFSSRN